MNRLGYDTRETCFRFRHTGQTEGNRWLTKRELEMANIIGVKWYPAFHGLEQDDNSQGVECPTPEICGWYCTDEDRRRLLTAMENLQLKPEKRIVFTKVMYADGSSEEIRYE